MPDQPTIAQIIERRQGATDLEVAIAIDASVGAEVARLRAAALSAEEAAARGVSDDDTNLELQAAADAARDELAEFIGAWAESGDIVTFSFRALGRRRYDQLRRQHPPTDGQRDQLDARIGVAARWNTDTFPPALVAACATSPEMTEDEAGDLLDHLPHAEAQALFETALAACFGTGQLEAIDRGKSSTRTPS